MRLPGNLFCNQQSQTAGAPGNQIDPTVSPWKPLFLPRCFKPAPASDCPLSVLIANPAIHRATAVVLQLRQDAFRLFSLIHFDQLPDEFRVFQPGCLQQSRKSRKEPSFPGVPHHNLDQHPPLRLVFEYALNALKGLNSIGLEPFINPALPGSKGKHLHSSVQTRFESLVQSFVWLTKQDHSPIIGRDFGFQRYILLFPCRLK
ncbi:hypothetical protein D1872_218790 [compost metagenome]